MIAGAVACAVAVQLAAGAVVDAAASTEFRNGLMEPGDDAEVLTTLTVVPALIATPSLRAALESEGKAASAGYALQLSGIADPLALALLHRGEAGLELELAPQVRLRGIFGLQAGELDPLQARLTLADTGRTATDDATLPFAAGSAALTAQADLTRRLVVDATAEAGGTSIGPGTAQAIYTGALRLGAGYAVSRADDARLELSAHVAQRGEEAVSEFDAAPGLTGRVDWTHALSRNTGLGIGAGATALALMSAGDWITTALRPVGDVRAFAGWDFGDARALTADARVGVGVTANPVGGIAEGRLQASLGIDAALAPGVGAGVSFAGFAPQRVTGGAPLDLSPSGLATARSSWSMNDSLTLHGSLWANAVAPIAGVRLEAMGLAIGLTGNAEVWHTGGRPRGTDPRAGRNVGVSRIGATPAPGTQRREEPPLPPPQVAPEPPPPALAPPAVQPPIEPPPPPPPVHLQRLKKKPKPKPGQTAPLGGTAADAEDDADSDADVETDADGTGPGEPTGSGQP